MYAIELSPKYDYNSLVSLVTGRDPDTDIPTNDIGFVEALDGRVIALSHFEKYGTFCGELQAPAEFDPNCHILVCCYPHTAKSLIETQVIGDWDELTATSVYRDELDRLYLIVMRYGDYDDVNWQYQLSNLYNRPFLSDRSM